LLEKWKAEDTEAREIRKRFADWAFIESQPKPIRSALKCFVELGDMRLAAKITGLSIDEFNQLRTQAKIPVVV